MQRAKISETQRLRKIHVFNGNFPEKQVEVLLFRARVGHLGERLVITGPGALNPVNPSSEQLGPVDQASSVHLLGAELCGAPGGGNRTATSARGQLDGLVCRGLAGRTQGTGGAGQ